jgi:hypothetical protein
MAVCRRCYLCPVKGVGTSKLSKDSRKHTFLLLYAAVVQSMYILQLTESDLCFPLSVDSMSYVYFLGLLLCVKASVEMCVC